MNRRTLLASTAAAMVSLPAIVRAQGGPLKVGVLLPRSGLQALIGRDCQRGVELAAPILKDLGLPDLAIMNADTESNVDTARARAEKLISDGAQLLIGAFDSGHTTTIAQVAEQKGIPLVINIAASPAITEQGYKFVFRNFPRWRVLSLSRRRRVRDSGGMEGLFGTRVLWGITPARHERAYRDNLTEHLVRRSVCRRGAGDAFALAKGRVASSKSPLANVASPRPQSNAARSGRRSDFGVRLSRRIEQTASIRR